MSNVVAKARAAWGEGIPDWVLTLANACAAASQNKVAARLNRSASLVSAVLAAKYQGDLEAVEEVVRGVFEAATVECPALGTVPANECRDWQRKCRSFNPVNALRRDMYRACTRCPRFRKAGAE